MSHTAEHNSAAWPQPENIRTIRDSFAAIRLSDREAGLVFYKRLFQVAPGVRPLFPASLEDQSEKLFKTLKILVASLDRLDTVVPVLHDLGRRHTAYGAKPEHYAVVGAALIWTLREALGDAFTPAVEQDWLQLFSVASAAMLHGAAQAN
jgi:hemoglobin-like flavoprotein